VSDISKAAEGHWRELLPQLGVDARYLVNRHGPCPICDGKDRFRWDDQNNGGGFICGQCGSGDGFDLAIKVTGQTFKQLADKIDQILGHNSGAYTAEIDLSEVRNRHAMQRAWEAARRPSLYGPVAAYLEERVGCLWPSLSIREAFYGGRPQMVCVVIDHTGTRSVNVHSTLLNQDGTKADVERPKLVMKGTLPDGCAIRLGPIKAVMGVAEGIETAISAAIMFDMPVWACVNGNLLSKWIPPTQAEQITVFGDNDANFTGQSKAYHLANRLEVQYKRRVNVMIPPVAGEDWNDILHKTQGQTGVSFLRVVK